MTSIAELTKDNNCLKQIVKDLKQQLALTQHDLKLAQQDLENYADEYAGLVAEKDETNFDDANMEFYWAATNGDVIFWKVPCELHDLTEEDGETSRVLSAFQRERFGDEWGSLSSHTVRMLTLEILEENE